MAHRSVFNKRLSRTTDWPLVQRSLCSVLSSTTPAHVPGIRSSQEFARRMLRSQSLLRGVLKGTAADRVQTVAVPASGGDVLTALAAFPRAVDITLISREPALASHEQDLLSLLKTPMPAAALAELRAVFACGRGGGCAGESSCAHLQSAGDSARALGGTLHRRRCRHEHYRVAERFLAAVGGLAWLPWWHCWTRCMQ